MAMVLAGGALIVLANVMADLAASLLAHTASLVDIPDTISAASANVLANIWLAMITAIVIAHNPVMLLATVPVIGAVAALYLAWTKVHQRLTHLQHTHEFIASLGSARGATATMTTVLAETAKLLRAGTVEIVLVDDGDMISTRLVGGGLVDRKSTRLNSSH